MNEASPTFEFPVVEKAWKPTGTGNLRSYFIMLGVGLAMGIIGGGILLWVQTLAWLLPRITTMWLFKGFLYLVAFIFHIIAPGYLGYLIYKMVAVTGGIAKNRNAAASTWISLASGIAGFAGFLGMFYLAVGGPHSVIQVIWVIWNALVIVGASSMAGQELAGKPWCEKDNIQMLELKLGRYPLSHEKSLMKILTARAFRKIHDLPSDLQLTGEYTEVTLFYCNRCREAGFIDATSHTTLQIQDHNGNPRKTYPTRLVYSSHLDGPEMLPFMG
jgi:hypothetical protein